jgi:hypothetical protein
MPQPKTASRTKREAVARSEVSSNGAGPKITVRGIKLTLPPSVKAGLLRNIAEADREPLEVMGVVERIVGPEQMELLEDVDIDPGDANLAQALWDFWNGEVSDAIISAYGVDPGE